MSQLDLFATTPKGLELLLVDELKCLGAVNPAEKLAGVTFSGDLEIAYRACLWSRLANRILLRLTKLPVTTPEELYAAVQTIAWDEHLYPEGSLNVNFVCSHSAITHTLFGAQKVKDAIVDQFREKYQVRPNVVRDCPDISVHVYLHRNEATISLDLSGESLHKRGYRLDTGSAPLKENLAAAILKRASWENIAKQDGMLFDPMCGSGTLLIEGALIASDTAPGLRRDYFGFLKWKKHNAVLWQQLKNEANIRCEQGLKKLPLIMGFDEDAHAIKVAFANIERAGLLGKIHVEKHELDTPFPKKNIHGLFVVNPPYGERLGEVPVLQKLYERLGAKLKQEFVGWQAAVFTGNPELGKNMGLRSRKNYALFNGAIACQLLLFDVQSEWFVDRSPEAHNERQIRRAQKSLTDSDEALALMFANRVRKNVKHIQRWADREAITCYRVYDADLPEYAVAVDFFDDKVCVQEYPAPKSVAPEKAAKRLQHVLAVLPDALNIAPAKIFLRDKAIHIDSFDDFYAVNEHDLKYFINLRDANFEVGLPLEQRKLRVLIQESVRGKHFLNLFSGAGALTVCAAKGGAATTTSVDASDAHLEWTQKNLSENDFHQKTHRFIYAEVGEWVVNNKIKFDVIVATLPQAAFELRHEHPNWVRDIAACLTREGVLYLVTQDAKFKLAPNLFEELTINELTSQISSVDFARYPRACQCWAIQNRVF